MAWYERRSRELLARAGIALFAPFAIAVGSFFLIEPLDRFWRNGLGWATIVLAVLSGLVPVLPLLRTWWARVLYSVLYVPLFFAGYLLLLATVGCGITRTACL